MDKATLYPDLLWLKERASWQQIFDLLYTLAQVRYATQKQLQPINHRVCTKPNLVKLEALGYLKSIDLVSFHITEKTREILEREGYNTKILQGTYRAKDLTHALLITDAILKLNPWSVFYPQFKEPPDYRKEWLKPDACLIFKNDTNYKIQFLEVEEKKPNWENYLLDKKSKYERLAGLSDLFFVWWKRRAENLGLPMGKIDDFGFSVLVVGGVKKEWDGWNFIAI